MKKQKPIEIFMPPNVLKARVGGATVGLDMAAVKRAEEALATLKTEFADWIEADVQTLSDRKDAFVAEPSAERRDSLYRAGHDLRGQARTFEFPLVERVAASLCRLLDGTPTSSALGLVDAHVDAIRVIVRKKIRDQTDIVAVTLARELEARVAEFLTEKQAKKAS